MSYNNLAMYDYCLLSNIAHFKLEYFCNTKYDAQKLALKMNMLYDYSDKSGVSKLISYLKSQLKLLKIIQTEYPQIVHFQWFKIPYLDYYFLIKIRKSGAKIVLTAHNVLPHNTGNRYFRIYKKIYTIADRLIVHSEKTKEELVESFDIQKEKISVIPHGTLDFSSNIELEKVAFYKNKFTKDFGLLGKTVFSALGVINDYKGIELIVDAWKSETISEKSDIHLIIAGKGNHNKLEELKNKDNVSLENRFLLDEEFLALLQISDYVLLPYIKISQSGVLLTAMNEKKKVIVSNIGGLTDPFRFGKVGYILEELTADSLQKNILNAIADHKKHPTDEEWEKILEYFNWKGIGKKTENLYSDLVVYK